ncbi:arylsulfatase [Flammeovirga sp. MY04]|uniref:arylsulfatase n=1 Tax=Flammeovirga sp. MY04 TaxID=1191459 RepID=UPI0008062C6B|nr:arylsulfatase [Flammeovirga sp. MY04]ANQ51559.1 arylsulfatase [Flammeovirga sp. MY04]
MRLSYFFSIGLLLILGSCAKNQTTSNDTPPNVILIITDDQGYGDIGAHGNKMIDTPHMDQLHSESVRLTNFHVSPTCAPSRSSIMTGRYANRVGVWHTVMGRSILYEDEKTMADIFAQNGYKTAMFGKWHLGDNYPYNPRFRGFQEVLTHGGGGVGQTPDFWNNDYFDDTYIHNGVEKQMPGHCTEVWFNSAMNFIEKNKDNPFFCYISTNAPHGPLNVEQHYVTPYLDKGLNKTLSKFYGLITQVDDHLGILRNKLEEWGIADNTILIFMTDNGTAFGAGKQGFTADMRGHKGSEYEGGHRVPCFIYWKDGNIQKGYDMNDLTAHIDLLPTLMNLCNIKNTDNIDFDGMDITKSLTSKSELPNRTLIGDSQRLEYPVKWRKSYTMKGNWRLVNGTELFDLSSDPAQKKDIADQHPELVKELRQAYEDNWADQEKSFGQFPYILLGAMESKSAFLTAHDWHVEEEAQIPWNQKLIRKGVEGNGEWRVDFTTAGKYEFILKRYPEEAHLMNNEVAPEYKSKMEGYYLPKGKVFDVHKAGLRIGDQTWSEDIKKKGNEVSFTVEVPKGETTLEAFFITKENKKQGAYYLYVNKLTNTES